VDKVKFDSCAFLEAKTSEYIAKMHFKIERVN
jgi:hypothetical protein